MTMSSGDGFRARFGTGAMVAWPTCLFIGLIMAVSAVMISPVYLGAAATTGAVVASPNQHAVISFAVGGTTYTVTTTENNSSFQLGQAVSVAYNPRNPQQASTMDARWVTLVMGGLAVALFVAAVVVLVLAVVKRQRAAQVIAGGQIVTAQVVGVARNPAVHLATSSLVWLKCAWEVPGGGRYSFRSAGRFVPNRRDLTGLVGQTVRVAIDPDDPAHRYVVDDSCLRS